MVVALELVIVIQPLVAVKYALSKLAKPLNACCSAAVYATGGVAPLFIGAVDLVVANVILNLLCTTAAVALTMALVILPFWIAVVNAPPVPVLGLYTIVTSLPVLLVGKLAFFQLADTESYVNTSPATVLLKPIVIAGGAVPGALLNVMTALLPLMVKLLTV